MYCANSVSIASSFIFVINHCGARLVLCSALVTMCSALSTMPKKAFLWFDLICMYTCVHAYA